MREIKNEFRIKLVSSSSAYLIEAEFERELTNRSELRLNFLDELAQLVTDLSLTENLPDNATVKALGIKLYNAVFQDEVKSLFLKAKEKQTLFRIRLILPENLMLYPWEILHDGEDYLALRQDMPLVRTFDNLNDTKRAFVDKKLRVLFVGASPADQSKINFEYLQKALKENFKEDKEKNQRIDIDMLINAAAVEDAFFSAIKKNYDLICFMGHGGKELVDDGEPEIGLYVLRNDGENSAHISPKRLADALRGTTTQLVLLIACESGAISAVDNFANELISRAAIPATIVMQTFFNEYSAEKFLNSFLDSLSLSIPVDIALADARVSLRLSDDAPAHTLLAPVLYLQSKESHLFKKAPNISQIVAILALLGLAIGIGIASYLTQDARTRAAVEIGNEQQLRLQTISQRERLVEINVNAGPNFPVLSAGQIWLSYQGANSVQSFDLLGRSTSPELATGETPSNIIQTAENAYLWTSNADGSLTRIDPINQISNTVDTLNSPSSPLFKGQWLWQLSLGGGTAAQIHAETLAVNTIPIPRNIFPAYLVGDYLWIIPQRDTRLLRIHYESRSTETLSLPSAAREFAVGGNYLWILIEQTLYQYDALTGLVIKELEVGTTATNLQFIDDFVWLVDQTQQRLIKIHPESFEIRNFDFDFVPSRFYHSANRLWLSNGSDTIVMVDETTGLILKSIELPRANEVSTVLNDGTYLWFVVSNQGLVQAMRLTDGSLYSRLILCDNLSQGIFDGTNIWFTCPRDQTLIYLPATFFQFDIQGFDSDTNEHTPLVFDDLLWLSLGEGGRIIAYSSELGEVHRLAPGSPLFPLQADADYIWSAVTLPGRLIRIEPQTDILGQRSATTNILDIGGEISNFQIIGDFIWVQVSQLGDFSKPNLYIVNRHSLEIVHAHQLETITTNVTQIGNDVWVGAASYIDGLIYRLDARTGAILEGPIDIPYTSFGSWSPIAIGDTLWFTTGAPSLGNSGEIFANQIFESDLDNRFGLAAYSLSQKDWSDFIDLPSLPSRPLADGSIFWYSSFDDRMPVVVREEDYTEAGIFALDTATRAIFGPYPVCEYTSGRYLEGPFVWVGCLVPETNLTLLSRQSLTIARVHENIGSRPWSPVRLGNYIWIVFRDTNNAAVFNRDTGDLVQEYALGPQPAAPIIYDGDIWVYNTGDGSLQRISSAINP